MLRFTLLLWSEPNATHGLQDTELQPPLGCDGGGGDRGPSVCPTEAPPFFISLLPAHVSHKPSSFQLIGNSDFYFCSAALLLLLLLRLCTLAGHGAVSDDSDSK